jgi:hypothetical protein
MGEHTSTGFEPTPAIVRSVSDEDLPIKLTKVNGHPSAEQTNKIINQPDNTVSYSRGFGESGYRIQTVEHNCPECDFDRMIRRVKISPMHDPELHYWCLNPNCVHYVRDNLSYACHGNYPQRDTSEPAVFEGIEQ